MKPSSRAITRITVSTAEKTRKRGNSRSRGRCGRYFSTLLVLLYLVSSLSYSGAGNEPEWRVGGEGRRCRPAPTSARFFRYWGGVYKPQRLSTVSTAKAEQRTKDHQNRGHLRRSITRALLSEAGDIVSPIVRTMPCLGGYGRRISMAGRASIRPSILPTVLRPL